jgi:hypothetical protein
VDNLKVEKIDKDSYGVALGQYGLNFSRHSREKEKIRKNIKFLMSVNRKEHSLSL